MSDFQIAREILGDDFISPLEIEGRGDGYSSSEVKRFEEALPDIEKLRGLKKQKMILVAGPSNRKRLFDIVAGYLRYFYSDGEPWWYAHERQKFTQYDQIGSYWIAVSKEAIPGSVRQNLYEQTKLLGRGPVVANAAEMAWVLAIYREVREKALLPTSSVRTFSVTADGDRVDIGGDPIRLFYSEKGERREGLGILACDRFFVSRF